MLKFFIVFGFVFASFQAWADPNGLYLGEGLVGYTLSFNQSTTAVNSRTLASSQTSLGYVFGGGIYLGGLFNYTYLLETTSDNTGANTDHHETYQYYGPSLGYFLDSWAFVLDYFIYAQQRDDVTSPTGNFTNDRTGTGFGLDIAYRFNLGGFELGPLLALKSITYTQCRDVNTGATSSCSPQITQFEVTPYIQALLNFN